MPTPSQEPDVFRVRLRQVREQRELSQGELAQHAKMPPSAVSHFESGSRKPSFDNLRRLADVLEVTTDYLLGRTDEPMGTGAAGALFRDLEKLTRDDLDLAQDFLHALARRRERKGEGSS